MSAWRLVAALALCVGCGHQGSIPLNHHGLPVVGDRGLYEALVREEPGGVLTPVQEVAPGLELDIRYASANNFMKRELYPAAVAWLRCEPALALARVQGDLEARGLGLLVFDAYRPYRVTEMMWDEYEDPDYVADPAHGSRHNRGAAVDVTLVDSNGSPLPMPTGYDDFTADAWHEASDLAPHLLQNRAILREAMERHGFEALPSEWWHYDFHRWRDYDLLDLPHSALAPQPAPCP